MALVWGAAEIEAATILRDCEKCSYDEQKAAAHNYSKDGRAVQGPDHVEESFFADRNKGGDRKAHNVD